MTHQLFVRNSIFTYRSNQKNILIWNNEFKIHGYFKKVIIIEKKYFVNG